MQITIEKNLKTVVCGKIREETDKHGNPRFLAINTVDEITFPFYTFKGAKLWLELCGYNRALVGEIK